ncbi:hypothetical protein [Rheinheimera baltica]|uniref:hypothetical protein n=1 Tax=Rheinheimera baltica TaxID=67576 RepID=UPI0003FA3697|nr:hypothetical protein [Rheinheimera baltica]
MNLLSNLRNFFTRNTPSPSKERLPGVPPDMFDTTVCSVANDPNNSNPSLTDQYQVDALEIKPDKKVKSVVQPLLNPINNHKEPANQFQLTDEVFQLTDHLQRLLDSVDLSTPPGLAGAFCKELARFEKRVLVAPRIIAALNALALMRANQGLYAGMKSSFFSIVAALSATGKEAHQEFQELLFNALSLNDVIVHSVTSGKQIHEALCQYETPVCIYDECHTLFKSAATQTDFGALDTLMLILTAKFAKVPFRTRREQIAALRSLVKGLKNEPALNPADQIMLDRMTRSIEKLNSNNWRNPYFAFVGYSTPINTDFIVNTQNIDAGLMGRPLFMRVAEYRDAINAHKDLDGPTDMLLERFRACRENQGSITISADANDLINEFVQFFEDNRNHRQFGAIYARGTEHVIRVSSLLAAETLVITKIEVMYAAKLFLNSLASLQAVASGADLNFLFQSALETIQKAAAGKDKLLTIAMLANKLTSSNKHIRGYRAQDPKIAHKMVLQAIDEGFLHLQGKHVKLPRDQEPTRQ